MKKAEILATEDKDLTAAQLKKKNNWLGLPTEEVVEETTEVEESTEEVVEETTDEVDEPTEEEITEKPIIHLTGVEDEDEDAVLSEKMEAIENEKSAEVDYIKDIRFDVDKISKLASSIQLQHLLNE